MDDASSLVMHDDEDVDRLEEESEITGPDILSMVSQKRSPILTWVPLAHLAHVAFDGALVDLDAQLEQFTADLLGALFGILEGHLFDKVVP